jgi:hypothetical protein
MRIGIDVNGVLRNTIEKFTQVYQKHNIESIDDTFGQTFTLDESGNTEEQMYTHFKYETDLPVKSLNLMNHFKFQSAEEYFSFMYEDFPMEIFGHSPSVEMSTFKDLNSMYFDLRDKHDFVIVSDEIGKSKPATLFFLSKFICEIEKIIFFNTVTVNSMWNDIDVLLTANPNLLLNHPSDKRVIKYETVYNEDILVEEKIKKIKELKEKIELC